MDDNKPPDSILPIKPAPEESTANETDKNEEVIDVPAKKRRKFDFIRFDHTRFSNKQWAIIGIALAIIVICGGFGAYKLFKHLTRPTGQNLIYTPAPKTTEPSRLTGLMVKPDLNKRPITGVMIENSPDARPQSGLLDAGVVVEAIAEGGITRFLAMYEEAMPSQIGPVRSVRPYYIDFALPFQSSIAHVGGSPEGLSQVRSLGVRDLDEFANGGSFWRSTSRYAPHNVYTSTAKLDALQKAKGYTKSDFTSFPRAHIERPAAKPTATKIDLSISGYFYSVHYKYDRHSNSYLRSEGGQPHTDDRTHKQLHPKVVIALVMSYSIESDGKHSRYQTVGKGTCYVFQNGVLVKGIWRKSSRSAQITFKDATGKSILLNPGQTWITLVGLSSDVSYSP